MIALRENIGHQIAMLRKKHGLTIRELADLCGINYANVCKIENGKYNISVDIIEKICLALGATVNIEMINTLDELKDYINSRKDWSLTVSKIIELNGWIDESGEKYGICNDGTRRLFLTVSNGDLVANIKDL